MATPIHQNHAANIVGKTRRFTDALEAVEAFEPGALMVPQCLLVLEQGCGSLGARLAEQAWATLAEKASTHTGRTESTPVSTRRAIADECWLRRLELKAAAAG